MTFWNRIREWFRRSSERKDKAAMARHEMELDAEYRAASHDEALPRHTEEVIQPRQYPPSGPGAGV